MKMVCYLPWRGVGDPLNYSRRRPPCSPSMFSFVCTFLGKNQNILNTEKKKQTCVGWSGGVGPFLLFFEVGFVLHMGAVGSGVIFMIVLKCLV